MATLWTTPKTVRSAIALLTALNDGDFCVATTVVEGTPALALALACTLAGITLQCLASVATHDGESVEAKLQRVGLNLAEAR